MSLIPELIKAGVIDQAKATALEFEVKKSGKSEEEVIVEQGIAPEDFVFQLKSKILNTPFKKAAAEQVSLEVLELIPEEPSVNYKMVPLAKKDNAVEIGMVYPEDIRSQDALRFLSRRGKFQYEVFLITPSDFNKLLKQRKNLKHEADKALAALELDKGETSLPEEALAGREDIVEEAPIIKMVSVILKHAIEGGASDIHIEPTKDKLKIRFRLDGILYPSLFLPIKVHPAVLARIKILSDLKIDETRIPQDGRFASAIDGKNIDFRVSTLPTLLGEKAVIRVLNPVQSIRSLAELGFRDRNLEVLEEATKRPFGLILATGPTGSGKSTTLYTLLRALNKDRVNIITVEDPVEYSIEGVNQSQVKPEIGYTFARALRHILRQDPNVIMVGEIRDEETAELVVHAALTGHLVLSTLHTNHAVGAVARMMNMGIKSFLLPPALSVVIAQRLVRALCPKCKKETRPEKKNQDYLLEKIEGLPHAIKEKIKIPKPLRIYAPGACPSCNFKGYAGRIGLYEVLKMTDNLAKLIFKEANEEALAQEARNQGMMTSEQDGVLKVLSGDTTIEEIIRVAEEV